MRSGSPLDTFCHSKLDALCERGLRSRVVRGVMTLGYELKCLPSVRNGQEGLTVECEVADRIIIAVVARCFCGRLVLIFLTSPRHLEGAAGDERIASHSSSKQSSKQRFRLGCGSGALLKKRQVGSVIPFSAAVPFSGQTTQTISSVSPERDCTPKKGAYYRT